MTKESKTEWAKESEANNTTNHEQWSTKAAKGRQDNHELGEKLRAKIGNGNGFLEFLLFYNLCSRFNPLLLLFLGRKLTDRSKIDQKYWIKEETVN